MNPWQVLGVEPGSDRRTIKRAYTRLVKDVHPEDRPEDFMQLRQAYEWALSTLDTPTAPRVFTVEADASEAGPSQPFSWENPAGEPETEAPLVVEEARPRDPAATELRPKPVVDSWAEPDAGYAAPSRVQDDFDGRQQGLSRLVSAMSRLLDHPEWRNDLSRWEPLLKAPELNDFHASTAVGSWLLPQVIRVLQSGQSECPLAPEVLLRFDGRFQWSCDHSGTLPVIDEQLLRLCLLLEGARASAAQPRQMMGWNWLANTLFAASGRLSRIECLLGLGVSLGIFALVGALTLVTPMPGQSGLLAVVVMLVMVYSLISVALKRVRDAGIHPALALVVGTIFPGALLFFLFAAPKANDAIADPRLKYSCAYDRSYREYYVADGKRTLLRRLQERLTGIHPGIYLVLVVLWASVMGLLSW